MGTAVWVRAPLTTFGALTVAGFRRWSTYRQATIAGAFTNTVFGYMRCFVMLAVAGAAGGTAAGYSGSQLVTYVWVGQGLLAVVQLWGWTELADRVRSGDVQSDLLRPVHPMASYLAADLGRAGYSALTRFVVPVAVGALSFDMYAPHHLVTYLAFAVSVLLGTLVSFAFRYLINLAAFWLLDIRGVLTAGLLCVNVLTGLYFPLGFLPGWAQVVLYVGTPFPSVLQAPIDVLIERHDAGPVLLDQAVWAVVMLALAVVVQRRAERRLVIQGG